MNRVKIAIIGTGNIANRLAAAFNATAKAHLYAVASRDINKAAAFAEKHSIQKAYGSYDEAICDPSVDLVYIALPHPFHYTIAKKSLLANKNVLCEKPLTVNFSQAEELFTLAKEKHLFFSEAMWTRFLPAVKIVTEALAKGSIGTIQKIKGVIAYNSKRINRMTDPNLAGGMLLDCGIYLITSVFLILGKDYLSYSTSAALSKKGVDLHSRTVLTYPSGQTASLFMAMDFRGPNKIKIIGDKGILTMDIAFNWQNIRLKTINGTVKIPVPKQNAGGFEYMTEKVCDAILQGKEYCDELTPSDTLSVMQLMDSLRNDWGLKYPFE